MKTKCFPIFPDISSSITSEAFGRIFMVCRFILTPPVLLLRIFKIEISLARQENQSEWTLSESAKVPGTKYRETPLDCIIWSLIDTH